MTKVRNRAWLARFIATPDKVLSEKDPTAMALFNSYEQVQMPNLYLSADEVSTLIDYLETYTEARPAEPSQAVNGPNNR